MEKTMSIVEVVVVDERPALLALMNSVKTDRTRFLALCATQSLCRSNYRTSLYCMTNTRNGTAMI